MSRALSHDLRSRVLPASADGISARSAAVLDWIFGGHFLDRHARRGQLTAGKQGRPSGSKLDEHEAFIIGLIDDEKDITLNEMVLRLSEDRSISIGRSALDVWLRKRGRTFKKDRTCIGAGARRPFDLTSGPACWQLDLDPAKLVFIDETGLPRRCLAYAGDPYAGTATGRPFPTDLKNHNLYGRAQAFRNDGTHGPRRPDECAAFFGLHRTGSRADAQFG